MNRTLSALACLVVSACSTPHRTPPAPRTAPTVETVKAGIEQAKAAVDRAALASGRMDSGMLKLRTALDRIDYKSSLLLEGYSK